MLKEYQVIDADSHVWEPPTMWKRYLEPEFKDFAPSLDMSIKGEKIYDSQSLSETIFKAGAKKIAQNHPISMLKGFNSESHLQAMKRMGVDISFIYPSNGLWLFAIDTMSPQVAGAFTRAYNNWLRDFCSHDQQQLRGVGVMNLHAPEEMVTEVRRIAEFGWQAVFLRPNPVKGRLLSDPAYEPFWTECEELNMAVGIHEGTHGRLPTAGAKRFKTQFALHACSHPLEQMMGMLAMIEGGVLERHPKLRVGFLESGCGWLPYWLWRLDEEFEELHWEVQENVKIRPSEYFRRQCFIALDPQEPYIERIVDDIGEDNLIFGSDYPHYDHKPNIVEKVVNLEERLSQKTVRKILWDNPARFYGI